MKKGFAFPPLEMDAMVCRPIDWGLTAIVQTAVLEAKFPIARWGYPAGHHPGQVTQLDQEILLWNSSTFVDETEDPRNRY